MRALVQRALKAAVSVDGQTVGEIGPGLLVFLGVKHNDGEAHAEYLARKVLDLRIFNDENGRMNRKIADIGGEILVISQFTLYGDTRRGNRPSYSQAARAEIAEPLYERFVEHCRRTGIRVSTGIFGAKMLVSLVNDGPVTLLCEAEF